MNMLLSKWIPLAAAFLGSAAIALAGQPGKGEAFPRLADYSLEGTLPDLTGKVVVVDFWASWCGPCKQAFPSLDALQKKYGDKVTVVAVSIDESKGDMDAFVKKTKPSFTIVRDKTQKLAEKLDIQSIPTTFILGKDGKVFDIHNGFGGERTAKEYNAAIDQLLK